MSKPTLCVDFDGVIHSYTSGWKGAAIIPDPPVPGALKWLCDAAVFFDVVIYSTRSKDLEGLTAMRMWFIFHTRSELENTKAETLLSCVTFASEKPAAFLTIDDRAVCFDGDWGRLNPEELLKFKPWYQRGHVHKEAITDDLAVVRDSVTE